MDNLIGPKIVDVKSDSNKIELDLPPNHKVIIVIGWEVESVNDLK